MLQQKLSIWCYSRFFNCKRFCMNFASTNAPQPKKFKINLLKRSSLPSMLHTEHRVTKPFEQNLRRFFLSSVNAQKPTSLADVKLLLEQCIDDAIVFDKNSHQSILVSNDTIQNFCKSYQDVDTASKLAILLHICDTYGVQHTKISESCNILMENMKAKREDSTLLQAEERLRFHLQPLYNHLFILIGRLDEGVKFVTDLRHDAMKFAKQSTSNAEVGKLRDLSNHLKSTLSLWFSVGLLSLSRITWETPADILEKVARNEAVHQVRSWMDLKHRLGIDRRCYAFYHNSMPREPLILLHIALTNDITEKITEIVQYSEQNAEDICTDKTTTAIFYSITSTQMGLQGIEFGIHMIRAVVQELRIAFPSLKQFSSLSPIPRFHTWLIGHLTQAIKDERSIFSAKEMLLLKNFFCIEEDQNLLKHLQYILRDKSWLKNKRVSDALMSPIMKQCAYYLCNVKSRGYAFDPVANFHLRNGAVAWRINWFADPSAKGFNQSFGLMVNYRYYLEDMDQYSRLYILQQKIAASAAVLDLANGSSSDKAHL